MESFKRQIWGRSIAVTAVLIALLLFSFFAYTVYADDSLKGSTPENGIPLLIIRVDESDEGIQKAKEQDPDHEYGKIADMNSSLDHSVRCVGTAELKVPEGYSGGYGSLPYDLTTGEMELSYIRGRGNSTWLWSKKPYKVKFDKKHELLGMGKSKEWALLAESADPTLMKNRVTYEIGARMSLEYTPKIVPVEVVMTGSEKGAEYLGIYDLTETVKFEKSRLDLSEPDENATHTEGDNNITGSYLLSFYNFVQDRKEPESSCFTTDKVDGLFGIINKEPEYPSEDLTEAQRVQREYIRNYVRDTEKMILSSGSIDHDQHMRIAERMDLQTAADYWLIQVFSVNMDAFFTSSTYFYKKADGKLYWGPLWDFDLAYGRAAMYTNSLFTHGIRELFPFAWFTQLRKCDPEYVRLIKERWRVLDGILSDITAEGGSLDQYKAEAARAQASDYQKWSNVRGAIRYQGAKDYGASVEKLRTFINKRRAWMNANLEAVGSFLTVSFDAGEGEGSMEDIIDVRVGGKLELPACGFVPEEGSCRAFDCWEINGRQYYKGEEVTLKKDTVVKVVWKDSHNWAGKKIIKKATLSRDGSIMKSCKVCGAKEYMETIFRPASFTLSSRKYVYNGKSRKPAVTVKDTEGRKIPSSQYKVRYKNNKKVGKATVTVKMRGRYKGTKKLSFRIVPKD